MALVKAFFTQPNAANTHLDLLLQLVATSQNNSQIHGFISHLDDDGGNEQDEPIVRPFLDELVNAAKRGVKVRFIVRNYYMEEAQYLQEQSRGLIDVKTGRGCYGSRIHTKLFLFSQATLGAEELKNIVVAGSATMSASSIRKHQNTVLVSDGKFYNGAVDYWKECYKRTSDKPGKPNDCRVAFATKDKLVNALCHPYIDRVKYHDPLYSLIKGLGPQIIGGKRPLIRVAMARWHKSEREDIVSAIQDRLANGGCALEVVYRHDPRYDVGISKAMEDQLKQWKKNIKYGEYVSLYKSKVGDNKSDVHSKYLILRGYHESDKSDPKTWKSIVRTGSPNWTEAGQYSNDEISVTIDDKKVSKKFNDNFEEMKSVCEKI